MNKLYLTSAEYEQLKATGKLSSVRLLKEQPPEGYELNRINKHGLAIFYRDGVITKSRAIPTHYPSGDYVMYAPKRIACESKGETFLGVSYTDRTVPTNTNIKLSVVTTVKRVQDLTFEELHILDRYNQPISNAYIDNIIQDDFIARWDDNHAKPRKTADGLGYECFPYDYKSGLEFLMKIKSVKLGDQPIANVSYKGLPLEIKPNPMLELNAWRKE